MKQTFSLIFVTLIGLQEELLARLCSVHRILRLTCVDLWIRKPRMAARYAMGGTPSL